MEQNHDEKALSFFRIKTEWVAEGERGELNKVKTEELVMAANYTDAEATAYAIADDQNRYQFGSVSFEIVKTKIADIAFNEVLQQDNATVNGLICSHFTEDLESGAGLYAVTVLLFEANEKTGKTKSTKETFYMPATSNSDAVHRVTEIMKATTADAIVRDAKFDNAVAIYWPVHIRQSKIGKELN